jgi:hypothetical protein
MVLQFTMGTVFSGMGLATMLFPVQIANLSLTKEFLGRDGVTPALKLVMQCFGAQASLCGMLIYNTKWTACSYKYFGLSILPFLAFDYHFWKNGALTQFGAIGDAVGNLIFLYGSYLGHYYLKDDDCNSCDKKKQF